MDFRALGPFGVYDDQGREVELGGRQQRIVLATLLLHRNEVVSVDRLIDAVWDERAPANAVKNVQIYVSRLRKALEPDPRNARAESATGALRTHAGGYVLEVGPDELDVDRFGRLVEEGRRALAAGSAEDAATTLAEALALWRGPPLADFAYDSFAQGEIGRLDELRLGAVEERLEADLALGRHADVTAELQALVAQHPLRERLRGQLMLALYRSGRKAEALRVYDEARRLLAEELGLEPSESLQGLQREVLGDDPALAAPARVAPSRAVGPFARAPSPLLAGRQGMLIGIGGALLLAAALAVAALAVTRDQTSAGIVSVTPNSLAQIDPETNRVVAEIPVGIRPASVVFGDGALWVANLDDETVSRIDPEARRLAGTVTTGTAPLALAAGSGSVWAIGADGVVKRIDPAFNEVVDSLETVKVGALLGGTHMAGALASAADDVWAVSGGNLSTPRLFSVDAEQGATPVVATGIGPTAMAHGFGAIWVTDSFENTVSRIDPAGFALGATPVGRGASAIAAGEGAVWVAESLENRVVRIDSETGAVTATIPVGRFPVGIATGAGAVWVANRDDGTVSRIDPETNLVVETIPLGAKPAGIVVAAGSVWVTNQAGAGPEPVRSGGSLRVTVSRLPGTDPALQVDPQLNYAICAKLLNYPDAPAPVGTRLVPEVAAALPTRSADGRTYTFRIRKGFAFSSARREPVTAETFKYSIERTLHPKMGGNAFYVTDILGQGPYQSGRAAHIAGVVADGDILSITLVKPAPDFLARLATTFFCAVPLNTPVDPKGVPAIPSAGPYYVAEEVPEGRVVLKRNPNYGGSRPRRLREIRYTIGAPAQSVADAEAGRSDYVFEIPADRKLDGEIAARYGPASAAARDGRQRYFINPRYEIGYLALNTRRPLFSDARLRRAVNYAIDRRALAQLGHARLSGDLPAIPLNRYLPQTMPGASRAPLYPPGSDLRAARRLAPKANGTAVLYTCNLRYCRRHAQLVKESLKAIGLDVDIREFGYYEVQEKAAAPGAPFDILLTHWIGDYVDPSTFLNLLRGLPGEPRLNRELERVARLSGEARFRAYEALSVELARDAAPWVAYAAGTSRDFFSARIGCQIYHPVYGIDLAALCIRK